jgi:hypothetical protein
MLGGTSPRQIEIRRISHVCTIRPSQRVTVIAVTGQSVMLDCVGCGDDDQNSVRAAKVTALLIKRCRTVLTDHCRYIAK